MCCRKEKADVEWWFRGCACVVQKDERAMIVFTGARLAAVTGRCSAFFSLCLAGGCLRIEAVSRHTLCFGLLVPPRLTPSLHGIEVAVKHRTYVLDEGKLYLQLSKVSRFHSTERRNIYDCAVSSGNVYSAMATSVPKYAFVVFVYISAF